MAKIEYLVSGQEVSGYGIAEKGKQIEVPQDVADSLAKDGVAKVVKDSKIKQKSTKIPKGEE